MPATSIDQFRSDIDARTRLTEILSDEVMTRALFAVRDALPTDDAPADAEPIVSARILSRRSGYNDALDLLLSLTQPPPEPQGEVGEPTWQAPE